MKWQRIAVELLFERTGRAKFKTWSSCCSRARAFLICVRRMLNSIARIATFTTV